MILVNGEVQSYIKVDDRGFAYGDGVFETLRVRRGRLPLLDYHLERLSAGLNALQISAPEKDQLRAELFRVAEDEPDSVVKLTVTRGSGGRGYAAAPTPVTTRVIQTSAVPESIDAWQQKGMAITFCTTPLEGPSSLAGLKHLNRLPQVLAQREIDPARHDEGLMRDSRGRIIEGIRTNLFLRVGEVLVTPPVGAGVNGVMRRLVRERASRNGIDVIERHVDDAELDQADEIFLTNSVIGVCPVRRIADRTLGVGTMTRLLQNDIESELERRAC